jgi:hypothetical protein
MLMVKGTRVAFDMQEGGEVIVRSKSGMMHDPKGIAWPRCSLLVGPFQRTGHHPEREGADARAYFGRSYSLLQGQVASPPPRALSSWEKLGPVEQIWYTRTGSRFTGKFRHPFNQPGVVTQIFKGKGRPPILYAHGSFLRLEMQAGCLVDSGGIRWP